MNKSDGGYTSVSVLILILFLSALALGLMVYSRMLSSGLEKYDRRYATKRILEESVVEVISHLKTDPTPDADSPNDPVWSWIENRDSTEPEIVLEDVSSRFNLNFVRTKMLEKSDFASMMINGMSPEDLKQYRGEEGFSEDLMSGYGEFFSEEDLDKYFTVYSYANLNVTYEDSLKKIFEIRVDEGGSHIFLSEIQTLIASQEMADQAEMNRILGQSRKDLYPLINIEPLINVNFADEDILKAVLYYPYGEERHERASDYLDILKAERSAMEIESARLDEILNVDGNYLRIKQYLGTTTWFWKIRAEYEDEILNVILARMPGNKEGEEESAFRIILWQFNS
ncbi:hypothetical protein [Spirochaeta isovalerica]|uniref:Type II secretory pathway, component PulK n=1 Tax=Spirochaeta isovalerica TaxID=150 RepID=A0A841R3W5_9SPIO|nr:hypothetical protein [Spirochaeta isovalerica]MBB6478493.1 hypothetical protein [Spirochaeta isovalerica]